MTCITFGVAASLYASNMAVKQNMLDLALQYPLAVKSVDLSFYMEDTLTGADLVEEAVTVQQQLHELCDCGGFTLRKWNSSNPAVLQHIPDELKDTQVQYTLPDTSEYTKMLGINGKLF